ncbi:acetyltransferase family protein [Burkholderia thailandensis]|uniref:Acetyltransferase family protein n=1 Tax=Burkholderia thailandensis TaxID=57975 RepID=A0AAW9D6G5_BURTH|nr:acetyltransferase family protein [Burkholderia thailandensis]
MITRLPENPPHRADVAKMLVHRAARRRGIAQRLRAALEGAARAAGKTILVLDTVTGGNAERLNERAGWQRVGVVPDYALMPDGAPCATTFSTRGSERRLAPSSWRLRGAFVAALRLLCGFFAPLRPLRAARRAGFRSRAAPSRHLSIARHRGRALSSPERPFHLRIAPCTMYVA